MIIGIYIKLKVVKSGVKLDKHHQLNVVKDPIDAIRSSVKDVQTDITKKGSFTFRVAPKDRFQNPIGVAEKDNRKSAKISVQYSSHDQPESLKFLQCSTTPSSNADGDVYVLNCTGAEKERILFYPSINNVPLGGQDKYEARTTLCPGKSSCEVIYAVDHKSTSRLALLLVCGGVALLVIVVVAVLCFVRYRSGWYAVEKKRRKAERVERARAEQLEMEVEQRGNDSTDDPTLQRYKSLPAYSAFYPQLHHHHQSAAIQPNFEGKKPGTTRSAHVESKQMNWRKKAAPTGTFPEKTAKTMINRKKNIEGGMIRFTITKASCCI
ncbi:hypothetical protein ACROYT_G025051 [Oculina patagonica]